MFLFLLKKSKKHDASKRMEGKRSTVYVTDFLSRFEFFLSPFPFVSTFRPLVTDHGTRRPLEGVKIVIRLSHRGKEKKNRVA